MKKEYIKPEIEFEYIAAESIMAGSDRPDTERYVSGTPTEDGTSMNVYDGSGFDPYSGHGQGTDGGGNRAKSSFAFNDSWEEEMW